MSPQQQPIGWDATGKPLYETPKTVPQADEPAFKRWYADQSKRYGLNPDPDGQFYDYRGAFREGAKPDASGHWPSKFKQPGHPNEVVGGFNTRTAERVHGTPQASESELIALGWDAATARRLSATNSDSKTIGWDASGNPITDAPAATTPKASSGKPQGFISNLAAGLNPIPLLAALNDDKTNPGEAAFLRGAGAPPGLGNVIRGVVEAQKGEWQKAKEAYDTGHYGNAIMYALSSAAPIVGPTVTGIGEQVKEGDYGGAVGAVTALAGPAALTKVKLPKVPVTPAMGRGNAVTREAAAFADRRGIPIDAGTVTGNPVVRGTQYLADRTIPGSIVAGKATDAQQTALSGTGRQLAKEVDPRAPSTPVTAGEDMRGAVSGEVTRLHGEANQAYGELRRLETAYPSAFEVDMAPVKSTLAPIYQRLLRQSTPVQQSASKVLLGLKNILEGPDIQLLSVADGDLSAIKAIARGASSPETRDLSQGLAAKAVVDFESAVQKAVNRAGPTAVKALTNGRRAVRAKYQTQDILDELNAEPAKTFNMATAPRDTSIAKLRDLQRIAPNELPKVGRAFLDDLMDTATREGGFTKAGTVLAKWQNLGQQTKNILFKPQMQAELDRFFILAKRAAENPNPSGTAGVASMGAQGTWAVLDPVSAAIGQSTGYVLSKLLRSPKGIRLLADGLKLNPNTVTQKAWLASVGALLNQEKD